MYIRTYIQRLHNSETLPTEPPYTHHAWVHGFTLQHHHDHAFFISAIKATTFFFPHGQLDKNGA